MLWLIGWMNRRRGEHAGGVDIHSSFFFFLPQVLRRLLPSVLPAVQRHPGEQCIRTRSTFIKPAEGWSKVYQACMCSRGMLPQLSICGKFSGFVAQEVWRFYLQGKDDNLVYLDLFVDLDATQTMIECKQ